MNRSISRRNLIIANLAVVSYFVLIYFVNLFSIDLEVIDVFRELLTIPFLMAQVVLLVLGIAHIIKQKADALLVFSLVLIAVSAVITFGSFF